MDAAKEFQVLQAFETFFAQMPGVSNVLLSPVLPTADDESLPAVAVYIDTVELIEETNTHFRFGMTVNVAIIVAENSRKIASELSAVKSSVVSRIMAARQDRLNLPFVEDVLPLRDDDRVRDARGDYPHQVRDLIFQINYRSTWNDLLVDSSLQIRG